MAGDGEERRPVGPAQHDAAGHEQRAEVRTASLVGREQPVMIGDLDAAPELPGSGPWVFTVGSGGDPTGGPGCTRERWRTAALSVRASPGRSRHHRREVAAEPGGCLEGSGRERVDVDLDIAG